MKAVGTACLLAHIGCYVPATKAIIPLYDKIFTHRPCRDNEVDGTSSFMEDMLSVSRILRECTHRSLVMLDELGVGTSVSTGIGIAMATISHLVFDIGCTVLCTTHFHEIRSLESNIASVSNKDPSAPHALNSVTSPNPQAPTAQCANAMDIGKCCTGTAATSSSHCGHQQQQEGGTTVANQDQLHEQRIHFFKIEMSGDSATAPTHKVVRASSPLNTGRGGRGSIAPQESCQKNNHDGFFAVAVAESCGIPESLINTAIFSLNNSSSSMNP